MRLRYVHSAVVGLLLVTGGFSGILAQKSAPSSQDRSEKSKNTASPPMTVTLRTDKKTYTPRDKIRLTLTLTNRTKENIELIFSSGQQYDFEIRKGKEGKGEQVWLWSQGQMFLQAFTKSVVPPDKPQVYKAEFDPAQSRRGTLKPGTYTVVGIVTTSGRQPRPQATTVITIR
jgi:hypothetical protein